jgi:hypothetical protein
MQWRGIAFLVFKLQRAYNKQRIIASILPISLRESDFHCLGLHWRDCKRRELNILQNHRFPVQLPPTRSNSVRTSQACLGQKGKGHAQMQLVALYSCTRTDP